MRLKGKAAIVTGAGSGFGAGIAKRFVEEGAKVFVVDIDEKNGKQIAKDLKSPFIQADVTRSADWARLMAEAGRRGYHRQQRRLDASPQALRGGDGSGIRQGLRRQREEHLPLGIHALPAFRKLGGGCFVNIASTAGLRPRPGLTVYNSSKGAVILMSKSMAAEFGPDKVRVNCVNPVFSPTPPVGRVRRRRDHGRSEEAFLATIPLGRFSTPLDVANACLYLASDEAAMISGSCIEVDGARCV
jgi:3-oxoacyl-[acyl-carrier protein] reductase